MKKPWGLIKGAVRWLKTQCLCAQTPVSPPAQRLPASVAPAFAFLTRCSPSMITRSPLRSLSTISCRRWRGWNLTLRRSTFESAL
jgi:hypothetical protein